MNQIVNGEERYNPTASAEMAKEDNYNMLDGIINNMPHQQLEEKIKAANEAKKEIVKERERRISEHANRTNPRGTRRRRDAAR